MVSSPLSTEVPYSFASSLANFKYVCSPDSLNTQNLLDVTMWHQKLIKEQMKG